MTLNLKRIIDNATRYEGKKQSISRAQMSEARRCIFASLYDEYLSVPKCGWGEFMDAVIIQSALDSEHLRAERIKKNLAAKPTKRRHK